MGCAATNRNATIELAFVLGVNDSTPFDRLGDPFRRVERAKGSGVGHSVRAKKHTLARLAIVRTGITMERIGRSVEAEAKLAAEEERRIEAEKEQQCNAEGRKKPGEPAAPPSDQPDPKAQRNFTDPGKPHHEVEGRLRPSL